MQAVKPRIEMSYLPGARPRLRGSRQRSRRCVAFVGYRPLCRCHVLRPIGQPRIDTRA